MKIGILEARSDDFPADAVERARASTDNDPLGEWLDRFLTQARVG